jgi:hypothetical protein
MHFRDEGQGGRREESQATACLEKSTVFSVVTCVSDQDLLQKALGASFKEACGEPVELVAIDNSGNRYSAPQALNLGAARAGGEVLVFLHQDVRLPPAWFAQLSAQIRAVEESFGSWGLLGVFGVTSSGKMVGHINDPHGYRHWGHLPCRVQSLDEVCLVVRRDSNLRFDEELGGFHFYGADLCLQARQRGAGCYAIDACLEHLSGGRKDARFWEVAGRFEAKWRNVPGSPSAIATTCGIFRTQVGTEAVCIKAISGLQRKVWHRLQRPTGAGRGGGMP